MLITDINDHPPYFDKTEFNITLLESESVETILEQVVASDVDTEDEFISYSIISGNDDCTWINLSGPVGIFLFSVFLH